MGKESIVEIPPESGNKYRYVYEDGQTIYKGPVGDSAPISEADFLREFATNEEYMDHISDLIKDTGGDLTWNPEQTFWDYGTIKYRDYEFGLSASQFGNQKGMESFIRQMDKSVDIANDFIRSRGPPKGKFDIWYSDVNLKVNREFGKSDGKEIGYSAVVNILRSKGYDVHS